MIFRLAQQWYGIVCIVGLPWLHHIQCLADVSMLTKACNLMWGKNDIKAGMLPWKPDLIFSRAKAT
jgi:hypothetical protein